MTKISFPATDTRHSKRLITSLAVVVLAVMSLLGYLIWSGYQEAKYEAETKTRNYAAIIEARLDATLRRADADLQQLARTIPIAALSRQAVSRYVRELGAEMESHLINFPELAALRIFDANGDRLYTTGSDTTPRTHISDRSYFRLLRDNPQAGLVFSELLISRSRDRPSVVAAKALRDEQGTFRGIALAAIELNYFQMLFQSLDLGAHGVVSIYRSDDFTPVVRWPVVEGKIDTPLPPGNPARRSLCESQGWECGRYLRVDEPAGVLRFSESWNMPGEAIERFVASKRDAVFGPGVGLAGRAWQSGQPAWIADIRNAAGSLGAAATLETGMHCAFHFPVISEGKTIGVLAFNSREVREPDDRLLQAVNAIGSQIGQFLQRMQAEERIRYLATYDTLTRLPNRNTFRDRLTVAIARARRSGQMTALLFLDLDGFKEINDALGHATGDKVLQATAGLLCVSLRDMDTISRLGGDEFTVILENIIDAGQVITIVEKVKEAFSAPIITQEGRDIFVTASIGIALYPLDADNIDVLLQAADVAMYRAKQKGRNTYEFYASEPKAQAAS